MAAIIVDQVQLSTSPSCVSETCNRCENNTNGITILNCTGKTLCEACCEELVKDPSSKCPSCHGNFIQCLATYYTCTVTTTTRCTMESYGCEWEGKLKELVSHLDESKGDCEYVSVACPNSCDKKVQRNRINKHLTNDCSKRILECQYCDLRDTHDNIVRCHLFVCPKQPVQCSNECGMVCMLEEVSGHKKVCPLEVVECELSYAGCDGKFRRNEQNEHNDTNSQRHLNFLTATNVRVSRDFQQALLSQQEKSEQKVKVQVDHLEQKMDRQLTDFQQRLTEQDLMQRQEKEISKSLFDEQQHHLEQVAQTQDQALKELRDISAAHKENVTQKMRENEDKLNNMSRSLDDRLNEQSRILENKHRALELQLHKQNEAQAQLQQSVQQQQGTFEWRLKELADKYEHQLHARERQILMLEKRYWELQLHEKSQVQKSAAAKPHHSNQCPPYDIIISNFEDKKAKREVVKSPPMYTHPGGYKFVVGLWPHGVRDGNGTYLSVVIYSEHGPFDDQLKWPAKVTISLQLANQYRDSDHYSRDIECKTDREKVGRGISFGSNRCFTPHADLDWNHDNKTQYLKNNCLNFRVTKVIVHSS